MNDKESRERGSPRKYPWAEKIDPSRADLTPLVRAFDDLCNAELQPWAQMDIDPVRHQIDDAVAEVLDLDPAEMADWRRRIVNEPTVSNKPAA